MDEKYDIVVIGAGPAGSMAAMSSARKGKKVCLLERNAVPGIPARCGEGLGIRSFTEHCAARPEWVRQRINRSTMISPNGTSVTIEDIGGSVTLDRERMDGDLAKDAVAAGAELFVNSPVTAVQKKDQGFYCCSGKGFSVSAPIIIIADGVESRLARDLGWKTALSPDDIESSAFTRVTSPLIDQHSCIFYTGSSVAPGGYAWIFPRGGGEANVGLGVIGSRCHAGFPKEALLKFIDQQIPGGRQTGPIHCGGIPVARYVRPLVRGGALLVGDAARQVNCMSGAGIGYALFSGKCAGNVAADALQPSGINGKKLKEYEVMWRNRFGKEQERTFALKEFLIKHADDSFLDHVAKSLQRENPAKMNYLRVFIKTFSRHPVLLFKAYKVFR